MSVGAEWILNKRKERVYAIGHAKAVFRGNRTVDADLTSIEGSMATLNTAVQTAQTAAETAAAEAVSAKNAVQPVANRVTTIENTSLPAKFDKSNIAANVWTSPNSIDKVVSAKGIYNDLYTLVQNHNAIYRGKNITEAFESGLLWEEIEDGFEDIYIGDYFTFDYNNTTMTGRVAGINTYYGQKAGGSSSNRLTTPHIVIVCDENFGTSYMNATSTTDNGYSGSYMHTEKLPLIGANLTTVFGDHLLETYELISSSVHEGVSNIYSWSTGKVYLMSEIEVFGTSIWSSSGSDVGNANKQFPLFSMKPEFIIQDYSYWLKSVASATFFCAVNVLGAGVASAAAASSVLGVRPRFILK